MNNLKIFENEEFGQLSVIIKIKTTKNILTLLNYRYMIKLWKGKKIEFYKIKYRMGRYKNGFKNT